MTTATRERILTDNEKYGSGHLDEDGGIWIVQRGGAVLYVATNRQAAEDAVYAKAVESGYPVEQFAIQVWQPQDQYPSEDDD